jgi:hypothetical protein
MALGLPVEQGVCLLLIAFSIVFAVGTYILHRANDERRIRRYIQACGGSVVWIEARDRVSGLLLLRPSRTYAVRYLDCHGEEHHAVCKTSGWLGVFLGEDRIFGGANPPRPQTVEALAEENRRLREENESLKRRLADKDSTAIKEA